MRIPRTGLKHSLAAFYEFLVGAPSILNETEAIITGASPRSANITVYQTVITTGATEGNETLNVGNGTGAIVGQRKLVTLGTRSDAADVVVLDHANMVHRTVAPTAVALDAAGEYVLLEWNGAKWEILEYSATVTVALPSGLDSGFYIETEGTLATSGTPASIPLTNYHTKITTGGTQGAETANIGDGTGAIAIGQRKLVTLETLTDPSDSVAMDDTNMSQGVDTITAVALDAADEFILLEWQGTTWEIIKATAGVVTAS